MPKILVQKVGPLVSLQDAGRSGWQRFGVTESGVLDRMAWAEAQALTSTDCVLEMAGFGGVFQVLEGEIQAALTGAKMRAFINGQPVPHRQVFSLSAGDRLEIGAALEGYYGYLAFAGNIDSSRLLGAKATHLRAKFGGYKGRNLQEGDCINIEKHTVNHSFLSTHPRDFTRDSFRVVWSAQSHLFSETQRQEFLTMRFKVSHIRDRMAMLLEPLSGSIICKTGLTGLSEAVVMGDLQIAGDGKPRALLADRQPTGGYPRIATLISADFSDFTQLPTGAEIGFTLVSLAQAKAALLAQHHEIKTLKHALKPVYRDPKTIPDLLTYTLISGVVTGTETDSKINEKTQDLVQKTIRVPHEN